MNKFLIILLFCYPNIYGQNNDSINRNQQEKLKKILTDGEYKFNVYKLARYNTNNENQSSNDFDPFTNELIDLTANKNSFKGDNRENELPKFEIKILDSLVPYRIIDKDSIITLITEKENYPNLTVKLISNILEIMDSGYILNLEKEIIVKDNSNYLKSGWAGFRWRNDLYQKGIKYGHSVIIGRTYDSNKIYFNIKTFTTTKNTNLIFISVN